MSLTVDQPIKPDWALAASLRAAGMRYDVIAQQVGATSGDAVRQAIKRRNIKPNGPVLTVQRVSSAVEAGLRFASRDLRQQLSAELQEQMSALRGKRVSSTRDLANTKARQGRASVAQTIANTAATVFDWGSDKPQGIIVMSEAMPEPGQVIEVEAEKKEIPLTTADNGERPGEAL